MQPCCKECDKNTIFTHGPCSMSSYFAKGLQYGLAPKGVKWFLVTLPRHCSDQFKSVVRRDHVFSYRKMFSGLELQQQVLLSLVDQAYHGPRASEAVQQGTGLAWERVVEPHTSLPTVSDIREGKRRRVLTCCCHGMKNAQAASRIERKKNGGLPSIHAAALAWPGRLGPPQIANHTTYTTACGKGPICSLHRSFATQQEMDYMFVHFRPHHVNYKVPSSTRYTVAGDIEPAGSTA
eukprot:1157438-Pelagomonas_calceolata.AAC.10